MTDFTQYYGSMTHDFIGNPLYGDQLYVRGKRAEDGQWLGWVDVLAVRGYFVRYSDMRNPELSRLYWQRHYSKPELWVAPVTEVDVRWGWMIQQGVKR